MITPAAPRAPAPPPKPKGLGRRKKFGHITEVALRHFGPRFLHLGTLPRQQSDWCVAWPGFVGAHTSLSEQMIYRAIARVKNDPPHPEQPPYTGGVTWAYQSDLLGGRMTRGGQVCDFLVEDGAAGQVCFRLQSEHFHIFAEIAKRIDELFEKTHSGDVRIVDIYEPDFVGDCSGEASCAVVADALAGREAPNPAYIGTAQPTRRRGTH